MSFEPHAANLDKQVIWSYCLQLSFAVLFGPVRYVDSVLRYGLQPGINHEHFTEWIARLHERAIWTNVLFCLALSLACCVRQYQPGIEPYEQTMIRQVIGLTQWSFLLTLSAYFGRIERWCLLWCCIIAMLISGLAAEVASAMPTHRTMDGILRVCKDVLESECHPWARAIARPYIARDRIPIVCSAAVLLAAWTAGWVYLRRNFAHNQHQIIRSPSTTLRCVYIAFFGFTLGLFVFAVRWLALTIDMHISLQSAEGSEAEEARWDIGQIAAPFTWANLAVDVAYELEDPVARAVREWLLLTLWYLMA